MHNSIDRYVECTSSSIQALALFKKLYPEHRRKEVDNCISKGADFIESIQRNDGSWSAFNSDTMRLRHFLSILTNMYFQQVRLLGRLFHQRHMVGSVWISLCWPDVQEQLCNKKGMWVSIIKRASFRWLGRELFVMSGQGNFTTGNRLFVECFYICRVHFLVHSANKLFAKYYEKNTRQNNCTRRALGKEVSLPSVFFLHSAKK